MKSKILAKLLIILAAVSLVTAENSASAADKTWNGGGTDTNWASANNWGTGIAVPVANDVLFFGGSTRLSNNNNIAANTQFNGLTFNSGAGSFTLAGNAINLGGNITNSSGVNQTVSLALALLQNTTVDAGTAGILALNGVVSGSGFSIDKNGAGTLSLGNAANTFSGGLRVNNGTLTLAANAVPGTGTVTLGSSGGTESVLLQTSQGTLTNAITVAAGSGTRTISNTSNANGVSLNGNLALSSDLILTQGSGGSSISIGGDITGSNTITVQGGATGKGVLLSSTAATSFAGTLSIASGGYASANALILFNSATLNVQTGGTFEDKQGATFAGLTGGGTVVNTNVSGKTLVLVGSDTYSFSGAILTGGGGLSLTKSGSGTQTLSGTNTYAGTTLVSGGTLALSGSGTLGGSTAPLTLGGGTLDLGTLSPSAIGAVSITTAAASGDTIKNGSLTGASYAASNATGNAIVSANLLVNGSAGLAKSGAGTLTLSGTNTFTGATTVSGGMLQATQSNALSTTSGITVSSSGTILAVNYGGGSDYTAGQVVTLLGKTTWSANTTYLGFDTTNGSGSYNNTLAMAAGVTKLGSNTLTLGAANTYTGSTVISAGTLAYGIAQATPTASAVTINATAASGTATLDLAGFNSTLNGITFGGTNSGANAANTLSTGAGTLTLGGNVTYSTATLPANDPGTATISGKLDLGGANRTFAVADSSNTTNELNISALVSVTGSFGVTKTGNGTLTLSNTANTYTGTTAFSGGIVNVANLANGGVASSIGKSANTIGLLTFGGGTLQYTGSTAQSTDHLFTINTGGATLDASGTGSGTVSFTNTGALSVGTGGTARSLTLTGSNTGANSIASTLGTGSSTISLVKNGTGTWAVSGANTFTGGTTVTAGTLLVDTAVSSTNSGTGTGSVTVSGANTTLGGTGQITPSGSNTITIGSGSILAPGDSGIGTLVVNGVSSSATGLLTLSSGAKLSFYLNGTSHTNDTLQLLNGASGAIAFNTNVITFAVTGSLTSGQTFILFDGTNNNQFNGLAVDGSNKITNGLSFTGLSGGFENSYLTLTNGDIVLNAVPEPAPWLLLAFSLTTVMVFRRRRACV